MDQQTTNQVRQVLMNELGLSRESVREVMAQIVEETVQRHLNSAQFNAQLSSYVAHQLSLIRGPRTDNGWYPSLADEVRDIARTQLGTWIKDHLRFEVSSGD